MNASEIIYQTLSQIVDGKAYPLFVPESDSLSVPYLVYTPVSSVPVQTLDGISGDEWVRVQIDIYHSDYDVLLSLHNQAISALHNKISLKVFGTSNQSVDDGLYRMMFECEFWSKNQILPTAP